MLFPKSKNSANRYLEDYEPEPYVEYKNKAFYLKSEGERALKRGETEKAWRFLSEGKVKLIEAFSLGFDNDKKRILWVDSDFHKPMANVLRLEGKHKQAFVHICYWVAAGQYKPLKSHQNALRVYYNRCKFEEVTLAEVKAFIRSVKSDPQFERINSQIQSWR